MLNELKLESLHHAYVLHGDHKITSKELQTWFKENNLSQNDQSLIIDQEILKFGIDDAKDLISKQSQATSSGMLRFFVFKINSITSQAQNALLKVLEEPSEGTYFFFIIPEISTLIETLKSRIQIIQINTRGADQKINAGEFLSLSRNDRLEKIKKMTDSKTSEHERWTKKDGIDLLNQIEEKLYNEGNRDPALLGELREMRNYLNSPGSSLKMILEFVALQI